MHTFETYDEAKALMLTVLTQGNLTTEDNDGLPTLYIVHYIDSTRD
jgi:hypothetical protein